MKFPAYITRTVVVLSFVSLFTDVASEMLYPVMPVFLKSIGFSVLLIGILEGLAEATAGLSKGYFGKLSDATGKRILFVRFGYLLSAISKPMMAAFIYPLWIFFARTTDRLGKGIRTGARDALLSAEAAPETKGRVFGFHRGMDTLGAVLGPALALVFLWIWPQQYRALFLAAFIPGMLAILFTFILKEKPATQNHTAKQVSFFDFLHYWKDGPLTYRKLTAVLLVFTLVNSSDVFLLLKIKESGIDDRMVIGIYIFYNLVYALASYPMGMLADKLGLKRVLIGGLIVFAIVYLGFALNSAFTGFIALFFLYGIYAAATEGISKAWITNISDKADTATAIGTYTAFQSICTLIASSLAGLIWLKFGAAATFALSAAVTLAVAGYMVSVKSRK
ncbi:MAG: MFS transporter [Bacteroidales bacterium]|nr:MFS transporter [Bacteroidales bacterium]